MKVSNNLNMTGNQLLNALLQVIAGDASSPADGQVWYNSSSHKFRGRNNGSNVTFVNDGGDLSSGSVANSALATNPLARANHTGTQLAATISDFDTQVRTSTLNQMTAPSADLSINSHKLTNVTDPTSAQDAATKNYVDNAINGLNWKDSVRVASTANLAVASAVVNGATVDGVTLATGDRILLKNQTATAENGIYVVVASGAASRATDADSATEVLQSAVFVEQGTANADSAWVLTTNGPITLGTTGLTFSQFGAGSSYTAGNGLTLSTNQFSVVADTGISVTGSGVAIDATVVAKKFIGTITGDGSTTSFTITHNLNNDYPTIAVWDDTASPKELILVDAQRSSANATNIIFATAPANGTQVYKVRVIG